MSTLRAKESFTAYIGKGANAQALPVGAGELIDSENPVVKGREVLFEKVEDAVLNVGRRNKMTKGEEPGKSDVLMERATAEPGERRSVGRPKTQDKDDDTKSSRTPVKASDSASKGKQDGEV